MIQDLTIVVKFHDRLRVRCSEDGTLHVTGKGQLSELAELKNRSLVRFRPLYQAAPERIAKFEAMAAARSGRAQPDFAGTMVAEIEASTSQEYSGLAVELFALECVEYVYLRSSHGGTPNDYPPVTNDHSTNQGHRAPDPGMDFDSANARGALGLGVRFTDCEENWLYTHEDLVDQVITPEPNQTPLSGISKNHGTAVMGLVAAPQNGYGVDGGAPMADFYTYPMRSTQSTATGNLRVSDCVLSAIMDSSAGDVVLLEWQVSDNYANLLPTDYVYTEWLTIRAGSDAGVITVLAAGNGGVNLDNYPAYMGFGDSGGIMVGQGTSDIHHYRRPSSTHGTRVDIQAWGANIVTLGYGDIQCCFPQPNPPGEDQYYTELFSGTSGASALVAAGVTAVQSYALSQGRAPLGPLEMRNLLQQTGTYPAVDQLIGPQPNLDAALDELDCGFQRNYCDAAINISGTRGVIGSVGSSSIANDDLVLTATGCNPNELGIFVFGPDRAYTAVGNGYLCIQAIWRFAIVGTLADGSASAAFPLPPVGSPYAVVDGSLYNFQFYYRDGGGGNFTDALEVVFCR